jgi:hypothetical protein
MKQDMAELFDILSGLWAEYAKKRDFNAVLEISLASRILFRALPDMEGPEEAALLALHKAIEIVFLRDNSPRTREADACSFCGRKPPEVRLGAGADVYICDQCVNDFARAFRDQEA